MYKGGRLWFAMTTAVNWNGDTATRDGIYWAEVQPFLGSFAAHNRPQVSGFNTIQQSYWGYVGVYTYMGTLFPSDEGDASLVFNYSNSSTYPSILYTGRMADDAHNTLGQGHSYWVVGGTNSTSGGASSGQMGRWGDYSACSLNIQPTERAQLYCAGEYGGSLASAASSLDVGWNTYIYSLRME